MAVRRRIPLTRPKPRSLPQFQREVTALLHVQGFTRCESEALVKHFRPMVGTLWKKGTAPCSAADGIARRARAKKGVDGKRRLSCGCRL